MDDLPNHHSIDCILQIQDSTPGADFNLLWQVSKCGSFRDLCDRPGPRYKSSLASSTSMKMSSAHTLLVRLAKAIDGHDKVKNVKAESNNEQGVKARIRDGAKRDQQKGRRTKRNKTTRTFQCRHLTLDLNPSVLCQISMGDSIHHYRDTLYLARKGRTHLINRSRASVWFLCGGTRSTYILKPTRIKTLDFRLLGRLWLLLQWGLVVCEYERVSMGYSTCCSQCSVFFSFLKISLLV